MPPAPIIRKRTSPLWTICSRIEMRTSCPLTQGTRRNRAFRIGTKCTMSNNSKERCDSTPTGWIPWGSSWPELAEGGDREQVLRYLAQRFEISAAIFEDFLLFRRKKSWWILKKTSHLPGASQLKVVMAGLKAFQRVGRYLKPTTRFMQIFGHHATRSVIHVDPIHLAALTQGKTLAGDPSVENGYVILSFQDQVLGLGLQVDGRIHSQLPRSDTGSLGI